MKLIIDTKIFDQYPSLNIGVVCAKRIDNTGSDTNISSMFDGQLKLIK